MTEYQLAVVIFLLGGVVTTATIVMILRGHFRWRHRDPTDDPDR